MTHHRPTSPATSGRPHRRNRSLIGLTGVFGAVAATSLIASAAVAAPVSASTQHSASATTTQTLVVSHSRAAAEAATRATTAYWTPARMRAARDATLLPTTAGSSLTGPARVTIPAGRIAGAASTATGAAILRPAITPPNTTGAPWPWYGSNFVRVTNGKVFFRTHDGGNWVCSAAIVNTAGKDMVWTAGHCVYGSIGGQVTGEGWHSQFIFVPDFNNGSRPYGSWSEKSATIPTSYYNNQDEPNDMAAVNLNTGPYGSAQIANVLGAQGFAYGGSGARPVTAFGYPAEYPYNGQVLDYAQGTSYPDGSYNEMASTLTGGSSGGPWLINFNGASGYIWGANTLGNGSTMWSPYFGSNALAVYNAGAAR